jgi:hypothetical protein
MDLTGLFGASFVDWEAVAASQNKRTVGSRLLLLAARRYLQAAEATGSPAPEAGRAALLEPSRLPPEVKSAFAAPPDPEDPSAREWGAFVDAAIAAELEMVPYGERPVLLSELRAGLAQAADEAGEGSVLARWFLARSEALPGGDLPEDPGYLPV